MKNGVFKSCQTKIMKKRFIMTAHSMFFQALVLAFVLVNTFNSNTWYSKVSVKFGISAAPVIKVYSISYRRHFINFSMCTVISV